MQNHKSGEHVSFLEKTPDRLAQILEGLNEDQLTQKPSPDLFSIKENLFHMRDIEIEGFALRARRISREDNPTLPDIDGARLASERRYNDQPLGSTIEEFTRSRMASVQFLRTLPDEAWHRPANQERVGKIDLETLIRNWVEHDVAHLAEISALREKYLGNSTERSGD